MSHELLAFGIYPDAIEENVSLARQVRNEFESIMKDYADEYDKIDIVEGAKQYLKGDGIDLDDVTNAIIGSMFHILESSINDITIGHGDTAMSIIISSDVNCDGSHLYASVNYNDGSDNTGPEALYDGDDLRHVFNDGLADMICDKVINALLDEIDDDISHDNLLERLNSEAESIVSNISDDISNGVIDTDDIRTFLNEGSFEGTLNDVKNDLKECYSEDKTSKHEIGR